MKAAAFLGGSSPPTFWTQDPFTLMKISEDPKDFVLCGLSYILFSYLDTWCKLSPPAFCSVAFWSREGFLMPLRYPVRVMHTQMALTSSILLFVLLLQPSRI